MSTHKLQSQLYLLHKYWRSKRKVRKWVPLFPLSPLFIAPPRSSAYPLCQPWHEFKLTEPINSQEQTECLYSESGELPYYISVFLIPILCDFYLPRDRVSTLFFWCFTIFTPSPPPLLLALQSCSTPSLSLSALVLRWRGGGGVKRKITVHRIYYISCLQGTNDPPNFFSLFQSIWFRRLFAVRVLISGPEIELETTRWCFK